MIDQDRADRFSWDESNMPLLITNETIQCRDCKYRTDPAVWECKRYLQKPNAVLDGGDCLYYKKK